MRFEAKVYEERGQVEDRIKKTWREGKSEGKVRMRTEEAWEDQVRKVAPSHLLDESQVKAV